MNLVGPKIELNLQSSINFFYWILERSENGMFGRIEKDGRVNMKSFAVGV